MPVSRKGIPYYTKEQYDYARYQTSALAYAKAQGYALIGHGQYYQLKDHDSMVFKEDGTWYWNSRGLKGGAIEFITAFENKSLVEAVLILNSESAAQVKQTDAQREFIPREKKPFELPAHASNYKRLFAYLCGTRRLDKEIVQELVHQKLIYESSKSFHRDGKISELKNVGITSDNGYLLCKQQAPQCDNFTEYLQIQMQTIEAQQAALQNSLTENNELEL